MSKTKIPIVYIAADGTRISLKNLTEEKRSFYLKARRAFRANCDWFEFENFLFGPNSPIYRGQRSHLKVLKDKLYLTLKDMWLRLGIRQGYIKKKARKYLLRTS